MRHIQLGSTGLSIAPLIFGTLPLGPLQANLTPAEGARLLRYALERGVNMFDTATLYNNYPHLRLALDGWREPVVIATKTHAADAPTARAQVELALRELGREQLDLVLVHAARSANPFVERSAVLEELLQQKAAGKIAHVGLSTHYISAVRLAASHPEIEVVHPLINRIGMGIIDGSAAEMADAIAACAATGTGIYAMKALAGGNLISQARASLAYVTGLAGVQALALGMLSENEIDANIAFFATGVADEAVWNRLENRRRRLRIMEAFCKGCGQCVTACANNSLRMVDGKAQVDEESCVLCGYCGAECPEFLIRVV